MADLNKFAARENTDPNTVFVKVVDQTTGMTRFEHKNLGNNFETASI
jgi:hypothetical protein